MITVKREGYGLEYKAYTITEVIAKFQEVLKEYGDLPVMDACESFVNPLRIKDIEFMAEKAGDYGWPSCIVMW